MTNCLFSAYFVNMDSFPLDYMTIMSLCHYCETIYHKET